MAAHLLFTFALAANAINLATINPCPECPTEVAHAPITVTAQYQVVETCSSSRTVINSTTYRTYPCEPSTWVSTVIPTLFNGIEGNTTVTKTDQKVTFNAVSTVETVLSTKTVQPTIRRRFEAPAFGFRANVSTALSALPIPLTSAATVTETFYTTHEIYNCAPYNSLGPIAVPHWDGSGICTGLGPDNEGAITQTLTVTSCLDHACQTSAQTWVQKPVTTVIAGATKTITVTVTDVAQPTPAVCSQFRLKAIRDNTKFHHGAQGYLSFPGAEGVLVGKKEACTFSMAANGAMGSGDSSVCAAASGPISKASSGCSGAWTVNADKSVSFAASEQVAFCFAKDKTVFSRGSNRSGCKPVKFITECSAPAANGPYIPVPGPAQTAPPAYNAPSYGGGAAPAPNAPSYGGGSPAPVQPPSYGGGSPAPAQPPSYGGASPAPNQPPSYGGGSPAPNQPPAYGSGSAVPAPGATTTCTGSNGVPLPVPTYGGGVPNPNPTSGGPIYNPPPVYTYSSGSFSLTNMPTGRTTTKSSSSSFSLTDMPTGRTTTTTTTDMSADPSAADPTVTPAPLRFDALGSRLMRRVDVDADEAEVGQKARLYRRSHNQGMFW